MAFAQQPRFDGFILAEHLGAGGMAEVFRAHPEGQPQRAVVVKRIRSAYRRDPEFRALLIREGTIGKKLQHPNIIRTLGLGRAGDEPYILMEYVDGVDAKRLSWSMRHEGVPPWLAVHIASEVLAGLAHAHGQVDAHGRPAPILHRDISPENILISRRGRIKVGDFGVASLATEPEARPSGKLPYMAPEQFSDQRAGVRADLYGVGAVLWELLTGRHLFRAASPREVIAQVCTQPRVPPSRLNSGLPRLLDELVVSALAVDADRRPPSALALHASLQRVLGLLHPDGSVTPERVAAAVAPHLAASRLPNEALEERPVGDIHALLDLDDDHLFSEPDEAPVAEKSETTYAIIRRPETAPRPPPDDAASPDDLFRAYLAEPPIPARPSLIDTLDLAPGALGGTPRAQPNANGYGGAYPVWVWTPHGQHGPLRPARAFSYLRDQPPETLADIRLSGNGTRWVDLRRVAYLLGDELVTPTLDLGGCEMRGRIADASMTAILGTFARGQATSRLIFVRPDHSTVDRFELEIASGRIIAVHHNDLFFSLWHSLLENRFLQRAGLTAALHGALSDDRCVAPRLSSDARAAILQARGLAKRRAIEQVFGWRDGHFGSNAKVLADLDSSHVPILRMLPRWVARTVDRDALQAHLAPFLERPLWRAPGFVQEVGRLQLRRTERIRAEAFGHGRTLFESLEFANAGHADQRYGRVLAYLLLELGLLHERNPTYVPSYAG